MAELALSNRVIAAIAVLNRPEATSRAELTASTQRLQAADAAREAAEEAFRQAEAAHIQEQADHKEIEAKCERTIADAHTERHLLGGYLLLDPGDREEEAMEKRLQKYEQRKSSADAPAGEEVAAPASTGITASNGGPPVSQPSASIQRPHPTQSRNGQKLAHRDHLKHCPVIMYNENSNEWIELRCSECGTNISVSRKIHLDGIAGFQQHLRRNHQIKGLKADDAMNRCKYRVVPDDEVQRILDAGTAGAQHVPQIAARKSNEHETLQGHDHIIKFKGQWVELSCCYCKGNSSSKNQFFKGVQGLYDHMRIVHPGRELDVEHIPTTCAKRVLTEEEVSDLLAGVAKASSRFPDGDASSSKKRKLGA